MSSLAAGGTSNSLATTGNTGSMGPGLGGSATMFLAGDDIAVSCGGGDVAVRGRF